MSEPYLGQIYLVGYDFAQRGFSLAQGQLLPIAQYSALFSLYGTRYGGDGRTTFGLPDLRGRCALGQGTGPGLTPRTIGQKGGAETTTLIVSNLASHNHTATLHGETAPPTANNPQGNMLGLTQIYAVPNAAPDRTMAGDSVLVQNSGSNTPFNNMQPFLVLNYEVALTGIFPSRN